MSVRHAQFNLACRKAAEEALSGLSDTDKVHFVLGVCQSITDPAACGSLAFAARSISAHSDDLLRAVFERECG